MNFFKRFQSTTTNSTIGGRYRLVDQLGVGGFSQTFLAEDLHLPGHPRCVVKQLKPQVTDERHLQTAQRLFETEATVLYQLGSHNQIPRLLAHFTDGEEFYLVQELIEGEPLTKKLVSGFPWSEKRVVTLLYDLLGILDFVHGQNVIHRDIKPSNLICRTDGKIVLIDFGAVKQVSQQSDLRIGQTHTVSVGTQGYMPVEQLGGHPRFSSDIYATGMVGIQALTGTHPKAIDRHFQSGEVDWRTARKQDGQSPRIVRVSPEFGAILDRMVSYHFKDRYQSVKEVLQDLEALMAQETDAPENADIPDTDISTVLISDAALPQEGAGTELEPYEISLYRENLEDSPSTANQPPLTQQESRIVLESSPLIADDSSESYTTDLFPNDDSLDDGFSEGGFSDSDFSEGGSDDGSLDDGSSSEHLPAVDFSNERFPEPSPEPNPEPNPPQNFSDSSLLNPAPPFLPDTNSSVPETAFEPEPSLETISEPAAEPAEPVAEPAEPAEPVAELTSDPTPPTLWEEEPFAAPSPAPPLPEPPSVPSTIVAHANTPEPTKIDSSAPKTEAPTAFLAPHHPVSPTRTQFSPAARPSRFLPVRFSPTVGIALIGAGVLGIGLVGIATIAFLANLTNPEPRSITPPEAVALPCNEPPIPDLPTASPDLTYGDGTQYYGAVSNNRPADGRGIMVFPSGNRYDGQFQEGQRNGCGTQTYTNGRQYVGEFVGDAFNGQGVWTLENGDRYIGMFRDNRCHGEGAFVFADGTVQRGSWQNGTLIDGDLSCDRPRSESP